MEAIDFNDFSAKERDEIITAFLNKMREADSLASAQTFFDNYLQKFYKLPMKLVNDIVYCQRSMRTILMTHRTIVSILSQENDAVQLIKNNYLVELEDDLYHINAECQYLVLRLQNDVDRFCAAFTEQNLQPNQTLVKELISGSIVPLVVAPNLTIKPFFVTERPTETEMINKYIVFNGAPKCLPIKNATPGPAKKQTLPPFSAPLAPNVIKESRQNLQAALKRARSQQQKVKSAKKTKQEDVKEQKHDDQMYQTKEYFMQSVSLCTHTEYKRLKLEQSVMYKRKPKLNAKLK
ncbi:uncharacterized protein LOC111518966 [Drosophila willistoni]|uniref:uncharacterized protein LOC111518966 n=1 Tax=Drosophila willistoni TaxID=7260 RepID=UPI00017D7FAD|nr:uncharacterized protein LOC111518966 [Drosophila willistoni]